MKNRHHQSHLPFYKLRSSYRIQYRVEIFFIQNNIVLHDDARDNIILYQIHFSAGIGTEHSKSSNYFGQLTYG